MYDGHVTVVLLLLYTEANKSPHVGKWPRCIILYLVPSYDLKNITPIIISLNHGLVCTIYETERHF